MPNYNQEYLNHLNQYIEDLSSTKSAEKKEKESNLNENIFSKTSSIFESFFLNYSLNFEDFLIISLIFFLFYEKNDDMLLILFLFLILLN